jgi:hypothetical protein
MALFTDCSTVDNATLTIPEGACVECAPYSILAAYGKLFVK